MEDIMFFKSKRKWYGIDFLILFAIPFTVFFIGAYLINEYLPDKEFIPHGKRTVQFVEKYPEEFMRDNHLIQLSNQSTIVKDQEGRIYGNVVIPAIIEKYGVRNANISRKEIWADDLTYPDNVVYIYRMNIGGSNDLSIYVRVNTYDTPIEMYVAKW